MSHKELRVAMIGGYGHHSFMSAFGKGATCVAIAGDGLDETAHDLQGYPFAEGVPYFDHFEQMLDEVKPDAVSVGSWPSKNARVILAALQSGMHVVSDKPIANSYEELQEIRQITEKQPNLHLITEFPMRMGPAYLAARQAVRDGKIGQIALVTAQKSYRFGNYRPDFYKTRDGYPGTIMFVSCHIIDLAWWITGMNYTTCLGGAAGNISQKSFGQFEDHAIVLMQMEQGVDVVMNSDFLRPTAAPTHGDDRIRIAGSLGVVEVRDDRCVLITHDAPPAELATGGDDPLVGVEYLNTIYGNGQGVFSTANSLYMAEVLLKARDSVDKQVCTRIGTPGE